MNTKRRLSPIIIVLVLAMMLSVVPMFAFGASAEADDVTVKFYADDAANYFDSMSVKAGTEITLPEVPELDGYEPIGWVTKEVQTTTEEPDYLEAGNDVVVNEDTNFYALYSVTTSGGSGATSYVKADISEITSTDDVVVTMAKGTKVYALSNAQVSKNPTAVVITVSNDTITSNVPDTLKWHITKNASNQLTFYPFNTTARWLTCSNSNTGVAVNTGANKTFIIDSNGYLKSTAYSRWVGVYTTNPDWRCYDNTTGNTAGQTLAFYKATTVGGDITQYSTGNIVERYTVTFVSPDKTAIYSPNERENCIG